MLSFVNDYSEGAHEKILERLMETNRESLSGYGTDKYCDSAKEKIRAACSCPEADVYFLVGGTQTNQTVIDALLNQYEGVIAAETGHVSVHEAGAIEYTGHKVLTISPKEGKISAFDIRRYLETFYNDANHEHMVFPGMVYISHPTEYGTLYSKQELEEISALCGEYEIPLYLDGARLGYGLVSEGTDVTLADIAKYCDAFYIGGTKVGALCGEAVVFPRKTPAHFMTIVKQHGALLAKGRLTGIQFDTLFTDGLYLEISKNAIPVLNSLGVIEYFDFIADASECKNSKPAPDIFLMAAKGLNVNPKYCIGFEDASAGVDAINSAMMYSVGIGDTDTLCKAKYVVKSTKELDFNLIISKYNKSEKEYSL